MSRRRALGRLACIATVAGLGVPLLAPGTGQAAPATSTKFKLGTVIDAECTGEVTVTGDVHVVTRQGTDGSGGTHAMTRINYMNLTGVAADGTRYHAVGSSGSTSHNFESFVASPYNVTHTETFRFIAPGPGNDFILRSRGHFTSDATQGGLLTTFHEVSLVGCR
jgi:hypothetical protein